MAYLVIDLDLTVFVSQQDIQYVNTFHQLSPKFSGKLEGIDAQYELRLINPEKLRDLIETAYYSHDGVIILTAGLWDKSIVLKIAAELHLNSEVRNKFIECAFINPLSCQLLPRFSHLEISEIQYMSKGERIEAHMQEYDFPKTKQLVLLDDTPMHANSFTLRLNGQGHGVIAKTSEASYKFYDIAKAVLKQAQIFENTHVQLPFFSEKNSRQQTIRYRAKKNKNLAEGRISTMEPHRKIATDSNGICDYCCTFM